MAAFDCEDHVNYPKRSLLAAAITATTCLSAAAAQKSVTLHGVVVDGKGAPVAGANVTVYRGSTAVTDQVADAAGAFTFEAAPHEYRVVITAAGFGTLRSGRIPFTSGGVSRFTMLNYVATAEPVLPAMVADALSHTGWEYGAIAQGGFGTEDRSGYKFFLLGGHAGKLLTPELGTGLLKGDFEYAVEVFPFWQSYTPRFAKISCSADPGAPVGSYTCSQPYTVGGTYTGVSVTPIILRWNFTHGERWMPWVQGAGGVVWTNHKYPAIGNTNPLDTASNGPHGDTSVWNFTPQFGLGTHYFLRPRRSLDVSANAVHLSSASLGDKNPGVNASVQFSVGYTWWK